VCYLHDKAIARAFMMTVEHCTMYSNGCAVITDSTRWRRGVVVNTLVSINEVALHLARLLLG